MDTAEAGIISPAVPVDLVEAEVLVVSEVEVSEEEEPEEAGKSFLITL